MPVIKFTDAALKSAAALAGLLTEYRDTEIAGLSLRVSPGGTKTFTYVYRIGGRGSKLTREKIGRYPDVTLADARKRAQGFRRQTEQRIDPRVERKAAEAATLSAVPFSTLAEDFYTRYSLVNKKRPENDRHIIDRDLYRIGGWKNREIGSIDASAAVQLLNGITDRGATTQRERVKSVLSRMFRWGMSQQIYGIAANPIRDIERATPAGTRARVLDDGEPLKAGEIARLWQVWDREFTAAGRPLVGEQFKLRLLLAQRGGAMLGMKWADLKLDAKEGAYWAMPWELRKRQLKDKERGQAHLVPLGPLAVALLKRLRAHHERQLTRNRLDDWRRWEKRYGRRTTVSAYVFPGRVIRQGRDEPIKNHFHKETTRMIELAKVENVHLHDLRRTAATLAVAAGVPGEWADRLMDHKLGGVSGVYNRFQYFEEKRIAVFAIEAKLRAALGMPRIEIPKRKGRLVA